MADDVAVMYAGQIVEQADVRSLFKSPKHPYTVGLLNSLPTLATTRTQRLHAIAGTVPNLLRLPSGCRFAPRCPRVMDVCRVRPPPLRPLDDGRLVSCHLHPSVDSGAPATVLA
jgi:peptide/nickel transport system ATP-binding protein